MTPLSPLIPAPSEWQTHAAMSSPPTPDPPQLHHASCIEEVRLNGIDAAFLMQRRTRFIAERAQVAERAASEGPGVRGVRGVWAR